MPLRRLLLAYSSLGGLAGCFSEPFVVAGDPDTDTEGPSSGSEVGDASDDVAETDDAGDGSSSSALADDGVDDGVDDAPGSDDEDDASVDDTSDGGSDDGCNGAECSCERALHQACDGNGTDYGAAIGLGCPGEPEVEIAYDGGESSVETRTTFGLGFGFDPVEGERYLVLGTGRVPELDQTTPVGDDPLNPLYCNDDAGAADPGSTLPEPMSLVPVAGDCLEDPSIVGTGDCSNSLVALGNPPELRDLARLSISIDAPLDARSLRLNAALLSTEYPAYVNNAYSDAFIAWLSSEQWTGNVTFDGDGRPLGIHSSLFTLRDDDAQLSELSSTCMQGHGATPWTTTSAPLAGDEPVTLVLAVVDVSDNLVDSFAFIDGLEFSCDTVDHPSTVERPE